MTSRWIARLLTMGLACGALGVSAQGAGEDTALKTIDQAIQEASVTGDASLLERHLADDFAFTHFGGGRDDKAKWVEMARRTPRPYARRAVSEQLVETHGDVALVLGRLDVRTNPRPGQADARPACYALRYVHAYARRDSRWMFLSHHTTSMIEESHPCQ